MKKYFFIAVAALVASVACSKVQQTETADRPINYVVANYVMQTKTAGSFLSELGLFGIDPENALFKSVAFINADDGDGGHAAPARFYQAATNQIETITYTAKSGDIDATWEPSHTYYWPKSPNSNLDFFSWYDKNETSSTNVANATYATSTYTLAWPSRNIALKDNVMYADPVWGQNNNGNGTYKYDDVKKGVATLFHHALAQIRFQFKQKTMSRVDPKNTDYSTFWVVTVKNVGITANKFVKAGTLSLTTTRTNGWTLPTNSIWTPGTAYWASSDIFKANAVNSTGIELTDTADTFSMDDQMEDEYITILPQAIASDMYLNFDITIETKYGLTEDDDPDDETPKGGAANASRVSIETFHMNAFATGGAIVHESGIQLSNMTTTGLDGYWQMNKKYTYLFTIDPETTTILYDPAVDSWDGDTEVEQEVPNPAA